MSVLTRIKNNQITDATITGTKLVDQTITSNLFAANLTLASNITVLGNFAVTGTPTTINSINTYINDPIVVFNNGYSGSLTGYDIGMLVNRNLASMAPYGSVNTAWVWVENDQAFEAITTTETGTGITSINNSGFANVKAGNVTTHTVTTGGLQAVAIGNVTPGTFVFTTGSTGGLQAVAIGNVTPGTGNFTTLETTSTTTSYGNIYAVSGQKSISPSTGAIQVTGGIGLTGNVNGGGIGTIFGAIQNTPIGNITAASGRFTTINGTDTTNSTSSSTGATVLAGGVGIAKDLWVGGNVYTNNVFGVVQNNLVIQDPFVYLQALGNLSTYDYTIGFYSDYTRGGYRHTGVARNYTSNEWTFFSNVASEPDENGNLWSDAGIAYDTIKLGEIVVANSTVSTSTTTGAMRVAGGVGISGNLYVGAIEGTNATAYLYDNPNVSTLKVANDAATTQHAGVVKFTTGNVVVADGTNSTSPATGALTISNGGGLGVTGNVFFGKSVTINSTQTAGQDFIVKGTNDGTLIWARPNATYDTVIVGNTATVSNVVNGAKLNINTTDSILLPVGTNAQRPSSVGYTDVKGMFRYNDTIGSIEWYTGDAWGTASTNFTVIVEQQFNGDGSTTNFTLSNVTTTAGTIVSINGVVQAGGASYAYTVSGTTLAFTQAPAVGDLIDVRILTTTQQVLGLTSSFGFVQVQVDDYAGITFISGASSPTQTFNIPVTGGLASSDANVTVSSANTATTLDSFANGTFRSAKYIVQATHGTDYQVSEALLIQNGTTASVTEYGVNQTNGNLGLVTATVSGSNTLLQFVATNSATKVRLFRQYVPI